MPAWRAALRRHRVAAGVEHAGVLRNLGPVHTVVDIGANRGQLVAARAPLLRGGVWRSIAKASPVGGPPPGRWFGAVSGMIAAGAPLLRELYTGQSFADAVIAWLRERGLRLVGVYHMAHDEHGRAVQADFLFGR